MTNFFFFIPIPLITPKKEDREERKKDERRNLAWIIVVWAFLLLLCLGCILYVLTPATGGYKKFEKVGTVDCYLNGTSTEKGCIFRYYTPDSPQVQSSIITKKRAKELDEISKMDPMGTELYQMDVYSTGFSDYFVCTYPDMDRKEAWKDYKAALFDNSISKDADLLAAATVCGVMMLIMLIIFSYVLKKSIRDDKTETALSSDINRAKAAATPDELELKEKEELEDQALLDSIDTSNTSWHK